MQTEFVDEKSALSIQLNVSESRDQDSETTAMSLDHCESEVQSLMQQILYQQETVYVLFDVLFDSQHFKGPETASSDVSDNKTRPCIV